MILGITFCPRSYVLM